MGMSHEDRQWLEGRINSMKQEMRQDNQAMEARLSQQISEVKATTTKEISELKETTTRRLNKYDDRIRVLELSRAYIAGAGAILGVVLAWVKDLILGKGTS